MSAVDEIAEYLAHLKTGGNRIDQIIFDELPNGEGMTATDELRRLLDERGVEWRDDSSIYGTRRTVWTADGVTYVAAEVSGRLKVSGYLTPEQAVEATLGSDLKAENEKLRELAKEACELARVFFDCGGTFNDLDDLLCEASELGIEVDA